MKLIKLWGKYGMGRYGIVDDEIYEAIKDFKWFLSQKRPSSHQYIRTRIGTNSDVKLHRLVINAKRGEFVDHINRDTLDNRKSNLRICTNSQNQMNSKKRTGKSMINGLNVPKGIRYDKSRPNKPWVGRVAVGGKRYSTQGHETIEDCMNAYIELCKVHHGEFARISL